MYGAQSLQSTRCYSLCRYIRIIYLHRLRSSSRLASSVFVDFGESFTCRDKAGRWVHAAALAARCGDDDNGKHGDDSEHTASCEDAEGQGKTVHSCDDDDAAKGNFLKGLERNPAEMGRF